jgi:hypothetical protein
MNSETEFRCTIEPSRLPANVANALKPNLEDTGTAFATFFLDHQWRRGRLRLFLSAALA